MVQRDNTYSRVIAWLKILLPLVALGLLSTLFLISRPVDPTGAIPFSEADLKNRTDQQQVTRPSYSGRTASGAELSISAETARPDPDRPGRAFADTLTGRIEPQSGAPLRFRADAGVLDQPGDLADLSGRVRIETETGYDLVAERFLSALSRVEVTAPGPVRGTGPPGEIAAGGLEITEAPGGGLHLVFTNGVRLVYRPGTDDGDDTP